MTPSTEHLEEDILALYVLKATEVNERRREIAAHLDHCAGCAQLHQEITEYYAEVDVLQKAEAETFFPALQASSRLARRPIPDERGPLSPARRPAVQVFVSSFRTYPIRWSAAFAVIAAAFVLLVPKLVTIDRNPAYVRAKDEFLIVLNENGDELWKKFIGSGFTAGPQQIPVSSLSAVADVDGDGEKEIILMPPSPASSTSISRTITSILCYNAKGSDRWRFEYNPKVVFDKESFSGDYVFEPPLVLGNFGGDGKYEVVFVAHHRTWWPSVVGRISAKDGSTVSEYWHPGWIKVLPEVITENGIRKIVGAGYNNAFEKSALVVLDSRRIDGHAPATAEYTPQSIHEATEIFYALLPNPDLYNSGNPWTSGSGVGANATGEIEVRSGRMLPTGKPGDWVGVLLYFYFDSRLNCVKVKAGDDFINYHSRLEKQGKLTKKLDAQYLEELRRGVEYWDGEKFVKEVTMNKKYSSMK
ncbi:MAG: hypothetical protein Q8P51_07095 [Ignavibacteria bacterium]|nr:hypothetical protein [Ignavibacteria bacterium]